MCPVPRQHRDHDAVPPACSHQQLLHFDSGDEMIGALQYSSTHTSHTLIQYIFTLMLFYISTAEVGTEFRSLKYAGQKWRVCLCLFSLLIRRYVVACIMSIYHDHDDI
jgi:hypothetical protein